MSTVYQSGSPIRESDLATLARVGVATAHECMPYDNLMDGALRPVVEGVRIAGRAVTAALTRGNNLGVHIGLQAATRGDIIVLTSAAGEGEGTGMWGGVVTVGAIAKGVTGVVADGTVRDVAEIREQRFPVWSRHIGARSGRKDTFEGVNVPVACGGLVVYPGDIVVADDDGVLVVPGRHASEVATRAAARAKKEEELMGRLRKGETTTYSDMGLENLEADGLIEISPERWTQI